MIRVHGLTKLYGVPGDQQPVMALEQINLSVKAGEFVTLIGPSGCGKTTLLKIVAGLVPWDSGELTIDDKPVLGPGPDRALVFQNFALLPWSDVLTNICFGLEMRGVPKADREQVGMDLVHKVGLDGFERRFPRQLSGGMQQRVGLARALAVNPRILLMDEPFGALDAQTRRLMQEELLRLWESDRKTVIFVTHSMDEAIRLGDRVVLMSPRPGRVIEEIVVPVARPRPQEFMKRPEILDLEERLWHRLREMQRTVRVASAESDGARGHG
jgi:ABC-type nitrate/sulfonate/bicarbonate transport system ATPase subunit